MEKFKHEQQDPNQILLELAQKIEKIHETTFARYSEEDNDGFFDMYKRVTDKATEIKNKYPDYINYRMWHVLVGSTVDEKNPSTKFDFPDKDSLADFIRSL
ncbi:MAG: hypothetical protein V4690_03770 [Patescibacteria group bacterium]